MAFVDDAADGQLKVRHDLIGEDQEDVVVLVSLRVGALFDLAPHRFDQRCKVGWPAEP